MSRVSGKGKIMAAVLGIFFVMVAPLTAHAADVKVLETNVYEDEIYIFVKGIAGLSSDSVIQIGNVVCPAGQISASTFEQMDSFMRTLILVDNSKSIPEKNHADIQEILKGIISNSRENEQIKIGTFSREAAYLCDYTSDHAILENITNNLSYSDQDTYLSDVLYNTISELKAENTFVCTRILILSDGADDNYIGYTNDEVRRYIESNPYPVYTVGISKKNNASQLETMFSFSRAAKSDYFLLDGSIANEDVVNALLTDQTGVCIKITPDENLKDGSSKNILLKLSTAEGICELKSSVDMPFGKGDAIPQEPEPTVSPEPEPENVLPVISPQLAARETEEEKTDKNASGEGQWILLLLAAVIVALIVVIVVLGLNKRKKAAPASQPESQPQPQSLPEPQPGDDDETHMAGSETSDSGQEPEKKLWEGKQLMLRSMDNSNIFFKVPIQDVVSIGRRSTQDIVISGDDEVSREHCKIILRGGLMYLERCEHKNGTYYENVLVPENREIPIVSGGKIKIGQHQYCVELMDQ